MSVKGLAVGVRNLSLYNLKAVYAKKEQSRFKIIAVCKTAQKEKNILLQTKARCREHSQT